MEAEDGDDDDDVDDDDDYEDGEVFRQSGGRSKANRKLQYKHYAVEGIIPALLAVWSFAFMLCQQEWFNLKLNFLIGANKDSDTMRATSIWV